MRVWTLAAVLCACSSPPPTYKPSDARQMTMPYPISVDGFFDIGQALVEVQLPKGYGIAQHVEFVSDASWSRNAGDPHVDIASYAANDTNPVKLRPATICDPQLKHLQATVLTHEKREEWELATCRWDEGGRVQGHAIRKWIFGPNSRRVECSILLPVTRSGKDPWTAQQRAELLEVCRSMKVVSVDSRKPR